MSASAQDTIDDLERQLEDGLDDVFERYREARLTQLQNNIRDIKDIRESDIHGKLTELSDERKILDHLSKERLVVAHFYRPDFRRCQIMNDHLERLARVHGDTTVFLKVNVEHVPFLVTKFHIKVLPCVYSFVKGYVKDRIIGFEELTLSQSDNFSTEQLERRLAHSGVIETQADKQRRKKKAAQDSEDDEDKSD